MKLWLFGVEASSGVSAKSGNEYQMAEASVGVPRESYSGAARVVRANGVKEQIWEVDWSAVDDLLSLSFPGEYDVEIRLGRRGNVITGVKAPRAVAAVKAAAG